MIEIPSSPAVITVTPEMARDWLDNRNKGNRSLSLIIASRYAEVMKDGRWKLTHQGIAFDKEGLLLDGQHRLKAVVIAETPIDFWIIPGCERDSFSVLDIGRRRQAGHLIDGPNGTTIAAAARFVGAIDGTLTKNVLAGVLCQQADNDEVLRVVNAWPELVEYAPVVRTCHYAARIPPAPHLAVLAQAARTRYRNRIPAWVEGLNDGAGLGRTDSRLHLRNRFGREVRRSSFGQADRVTTYGVIATAWNYYAVERPMSVLKAPRKEDSAPPITS